MGPHSGEATLVIFIYASLQKGGQLFKERICSCRSKSFPLRIDPFFEGFTCQGKQTSSHKVVSLLKKMNKHGVYLYIIYLKTVTINCKLVYFSG